MKQQEIKMKDTKVIKTALVLPPDTNSHRTLFGGKLLSYIDDTASIAAFFLAFFSAQVSLASTVNNKISNKALI